MNNRITIIGAGNAGIALGKAFSKADKQVSFGVSNKAKYNDTIKNLDGNFKLNSVIEALQEPSDVVVLAVPYLAALEISSLIHDWENKILIDISTPWLADLSGLSVGLTTSGAEKISKAANNARVVKAFNTMGAESIEDPNIVEGKVFMPVCSDSDSAKKTVIKLGSLIGFDAIDAGNLCNARMTEPLVSLWLQLTFNLPKGRTFEFGLLKKNIMSKIKQEVELQ